MILKIGKLEGRIPLDVDVFQRGNTYFVLFFIFRIDIRSPGGN